MSWSRSINPVGANFVRAVAVVAIAAVMPFGFAEAKDNLACDRFEWSIKRELQHFRDPNLEMVFSGAMLGSVPENGLVLNLQPHGTLDYVLAPGGEPKPDDSFAGLLLIKNVPQAGLYQVTLSGDAWIDLIQDGKALPLAAETLNPDCGDARKSMRFRLEQGPLTVQVSGVASSQIRLAILPVE